MDSAGIWHRASSHVKTVLQEVQTENLFTPGPEKSRLREQATQTNMTRNENGSETRKRSSSILKFKDHKTKTQIRRRNPSMLNSEGYKYMLTASTALGQIRAETKVRDNLREKPKNSFNRQSANSAMATMPKVEPKWERIILDE